MKTISLLRKVVSKCRPAWRGAGLLVLDMLFFGSLNPQRVASFVLIIGFGLLSLTTYWLLAGLTALPGLYGLSTHASRSGRHRSRLVAPLTALVAGLIALQSIGQLAPRDVLVLTVLTLLLSVYMSYARTTQAV
jgi:hypothetical protein